MNSFMPALLVKLIGGTYLNPDHISHAQLRRRSLEITLINGQEIKLGSDDPAYREALDLLDSLSLPTAAEMTEDIPLNGHNHQ